MTQPKELETAIQRGNAPLVAAIHLLIDAIKAERERHRGSVVRRPIWTADQATAECSLTGTPVPPDHLVHINGVSLHPSVHAYIVEIAARDFDESFADAYAAFAEGTLELPESASATPTEEVYTDAPTLPADWTLADVAHWTRGKVYTCAKELNLKAACKLRKIDYRREKKDWMIEAITWCLGERKSFPPPESEENLKSYQASDAPPPSPRTSTFNTPKTDGEGTKHKGDAPQQVAPKAAESNVKAPLNERTSPPKKAMTGPTTGRVTASAPNLSAKPRPAPGIAMKKKPTAPTPAPVAAKKRPTGGTKPAPKKAAPAAKPAAKKPAPPKPVKKTPAKKPAPKKPAPKKKTKAKGKR